MFPLKDKGNHTQFNEKTDLVVAKILLSCNMTAAVALLKNEKNLATRSWLNTKDATMKMPDHKDEGVPVPLFPRMFPRVFWFNAPLFPYTQFSVLFSNTPFCY